jgi:NodT family efflux transporter outer membrane factor (OMF) lipoprotein
MAAPPRWEAPRPAPAPDAPAVPDDTWWTRFGDPALPALVAAARAASPSVSAAAARIERARPARAAAGAAQLPAVDAVAAASRGRTAPGDAVLEQGRAGLQAAWEIDLFGADAAAARAAQARLDGAGAALHDARTAVAAETAATLVALRACESFERTAQADAASREQTASLTERSARAGLLAPADAALARAGAAQARSAVLAQRAQCETLLKSLVELSGWPEPALRERLAPAAARVPAPPALALPELPAALLAQRPDLRQAALEVAASAADAQRAAARQWPQVSLAGALSRTRLAVDGVTLDGRTWSFGPLTVSFPLFDAGARAAERSAAEAAARDAQAQYRALLRRAVREVEAGLVALEAARARQADAEAALAGYEAVLAATEARQRGGLASLFDLEAARRNTLAARRELIDLQRERAAAWITLYRSLGGGFEPAAAP